MIEDVFASRTQTRIFSNFDYPEESLVRSMIEKTFSIVPSKQNLIPYMIHVLGPSHDEYKKKLYKIVSNSGGGGNYGNKNIFAPYVLLFTCRLCFPNRFVFKKMHKDNHIFNVCNKEKYSKNNSDVFLEMGMFSTILTGMCLEKDISVGYLKCFSEDMNDWKDIDFVDDPVVFSMQLGYKNQKHKFTEGEDRPYIDEVINWV